MCPSDTFPSDTVTDLNWQVRYNCLCGLMNHKAIKDSTVSGNMDLVNLRKPQHTKLLVSLMELMFLVLLAFLVLPVFLFLVFLFPVFLVLLVSLVF